MTLIEIIVVVVILSIAGMLAIPLITSADNVQVRSAANLLASDLEYAKNMSVSRGQNYSVVFLNSVSYKVCDQGGTTITHPVDKKPYVVDFGEDDRLDKVTISSVNIMPGSTDTITFDYLGSPYSGTGTTNPLNSGQITLNVVGVTKNVVVEPVTGYIKITD